MAMKMENVYTVANSKMDKIYKSLNEPRKGQFGVYKKCVFHLHTPASHDYRLLNKFDDEHGFEIMKPAEVFEIVINRQILPKGYIRLEDLKYDPSLYIDIKEYLAYILIADCLMDIEAEMVVVSDHNTIAGYEKLSKAVEDYWKFKRKIKYPEIICGIEISCADKLHIVGIFDYNQKLGGKINEWIDEYILSEKDGTYLPSVEVLNQIFEWKGIGYIAHIDTSNIFKKEKFLSGAYKTKLFSLDNLEVIGVSDISKIDYIKQNVSSFSRKEFNFVVDEDAHCLEEIGSKFFWIKGVSCDFTTIKKAIRDYNISVELNQPEEPDGFIKGMYIIGKEEAFLKGKNGNGDFVLTFSNSLNCFIGGRGTGKSTALQILDFVLGQNYIHDNCLELLCCNKEIWILYSKGGLDYLILFNVPVGSYDNISSSIEQLSSDLRRFGGMSSHEERANIQKKYIQIFRMRIKGTTLEKKELVSVTELLASFFDTKYSVNELVQFASTPEISDYIKNTIQKNKKIPHIKKLSNARTFRSLKERYNLAKRILEERKREIEDIINEYNILHMKDIKIVYGFAPYIRGVLDFEELIGVKWRTKARWFCKYNIKEENLVAYFDYIHTKIGTMKLYEYILEKKLLELEKIFPIEAFTVSLDNKMVDLGINELTTNNIDDFFDTLGNCFYSQEGIDRLMRGLQQYVVTCERYNLEFNINNKEDIQNVKPIFKNINQLSLGQKVVAMLSFVLSYSDYSEDYRPLIIDQPEDNLDNQYIYKNLVRQLREIKSKRQIIIATHNATIVTNAKAEQVIVMESDNEHGWIKATGYPNDKTIIKHIVNNLEGGVDSFKHKCFVYSDIIGEQ